MARLRRGAAALAIALLANAGLVILLVWLNRTPPPRRPEPPEVELSVVRAPAEPERPEERPPSAPPPAPRTPIVPPPPQALPDLALEPLPEAAPPEPAEPAEPADRPDPEPSEAPPGPPGPEAPAEPTSTADRPRRAGEVDRPPVERSLRAPEYPRIARRRGIEGQVHLRLLIDRRGRIEQLEVLKVEGPASFAEAVRRVAPEWRFEPAREKGEPVAVWARKTIRFQLDRR